MTESSPKAPFSLTQRPKAEDRLCCFIIVMQIMQPAGSETDTALWSGDEAGSAVSHRESEYFLYSAHTAQHTAVDRTQHITFFKHKNYVLSREWFKISAQQVRTQLKTPVCKQVHIWIKEKRDAVTTSVKPENKKQLNPTYNSFPRAKPRQKR